ncbi:MAG TPA: hypothetical protein VLG11_05545 [Candidatus Saccharimonadales bacterium]|nr:hypothetical protein [Candidatus Saccharimonadales bacterium]
MSGELPQTPQLPAELNCGFAQDTAAAEYAHIQGTKPADRELSECSTCGIHTGILNGMVQVERACPAVQLGMPQLDGAIVNFEERREQALELAHRVVSGENGEHGQAAVLAKLVNEQ